MNPIHKRVILEYMKGDRDYLAWKRKNVTLRGIREEGKENGVYPSFGKGLYTVPLGNKVMAKEYGTVHFVVNAKPKKPKVVQYRSDAENFCFKVKEDFLKSRGIDTKYNVASKFDSEGGELEKEIMKLGYDGLVITGREMVNYTPKDVVYFKTESQLQHYYHTVIAP